MRRLVQVVPYNLYLAMFSPAIVNVLCFDPNHGADQARGYAGKYCAKPEASYPAVASCVRLPCVTHVYPHASCFLAVATQEALI